MNFLTDMHGRFFLFKKFIFNSKLFLKRNKALTILGGIVVPWRVAVVG
jgi:hypothetical protein